MRVKKSVKEKRAKQIPLKGITGKVKPSVQDMLIAKGLAEGKKKGEALVAAGVSPKNARSNSREILGRPGVQAALNKTLRKAGITTERIAEVLAQGLAATKVISANMLVVASETGGPEKEKPCKDGYILDATEAADTEAAETRVFVRVEDFAVRHKYLETSIDLLDLTPKQDSLITEERVTMTEEENLIDQAERSAGTRNTARYMVRREKQQST